MGKKFEEMTKEELCKEAGQILENFRKDVYGNASASTYLKNINDLQKIVNTIKDCEKEKIILALDGFFNKNKDYIIHIYIRNTTTETIGEIHVPVERNWNCSRESRYEVSWNDGIDFFAIPCDEVLSFHQKTDEYNLQMVYVVLKCGISIEFECVGIMA